MPLSRVKQRLGVEGVEVRRPAEHEEHDDPLDLRREMRRLRRERVDGCRSGGRFLGQQRRKREPAESRPHPLEE